MQLLLTIFMAQTDLYKFKEWLLSKVYIYIFFICGRVLFYALHFFYQDKIEKKKNSSHTIILQFLIGTAYLVYLSLYHLLKEMEGRRCRINFKCLKREPFTFELTVEIFNHMHSYKLTSDSRLSETIMKKDSFSAQIKIYS